MSEYTRHMTADEYKEHMNSAMQTIVQDLYDMTRPEGGTLGSIFNTSEFLDLLKKKWFTIVPRFPTIAMKEAWSKGWFKDFYQRYADMIKAVEEDESGSFTKRTSESRIESLRKFER
jgi:hypothetical protein